MEGDEESGPEVAITIHGAAAPGHFLGPPGTFGAFANGIGNLPWTSPASVIA